MTGCLYDGDQVIAEFDNEAKVTAQFIHGIGLGADVGSLIYKETLDETVSRSYYYHNWRGDVIDIVSDLGTVSYRYDAFGNIIGGSYPEIGFSSKRFDASTELSYFGARYYDGMTGRFISRDPMEYVDGPN